MKNKKVLIRIILITATFFNIYGLIRYYIKLPNDILGKVLYLIVIVCLIATIIIIERKKLL